MPPKVPVIRRGREVDGAGGIGKVQLIYKPKKPKPYCLMFMGLILYSIFLGIYFTSFFWSRQKIRGEIIIPIWKKLIFGGDSLRIITNTWLRKDVANEKIPKNSFSLQAPTEEAVLYQQGYVHAKERIFQMEVYRRMAMGTLTEVFGNKTIHLDIFSCTLDFKSHAYRNLEILKHDSSFALLEAYARGVNDAIAQEFQGFWPLDIYYTHGFFQAIRMEPWEPVHSLAILQWFVYQHSHGWEDELLATLLSQQLSDEAIKEFFGDRLTHLVSSENPFTSLLQAVGVDDHLTVETVGSSAYAFRTEDSTIFNTDFIGTAKNLGFWYPNQLKANRGGKTSLQVQGMSFPGVPYILSGNTEEVSWTFVQQRLPHQSCRDQITLISKDDLTSGNISLTDLHYRKEYIPLREAPNGDKTGPKESRLFEMDVLFSPTWGINVYELLAPEVKAACLSLGIEHVFLKSSMLPATVLDRVFPSIDEVPVANLLRFIHHLNHAENLLEVKGAFAETHLRLPWYFIVGDIYGQLDVLSSSVENYSFMGQRDGKQPLSAIIAGANNNIRKLLLRSGHGDKKNFEVFDDLFSPAGWTLAKQLAYLLRQQPLVLTKDEPTDENILTTHEKHRQRDFLAIISLLESFDGQYTAEAVAPSILETFRMHFLVEVLYESAGPLATTLFGDYNITALKRLSELDIRKDVSSLLAPYVHHCNVNNMNNEESCGLFSNHSSGSTHLPDKSWWVEQAGGIDAVVFRSMDASLDWLYKTNEQRALTTWQWQNHHHLLVHHPVSPAVTLLDSVLGAGPELAGGNFDSMLRSDYSGATLLHTAEMLHGIDVFGSMFRTQTIHNRANQGTKTKVQVFTRESSVRHASAHLSFEITASSSSRQTLQKGEPKKIQEDL